MAVTNTVRAVLNTTTGRWFLWDRDGESGGFWTMEETWAQMIRPGYVFKYTNAGAF